MKIKVKQAIFLPVSPSMKEIGNQQNYLRDYTALQAYC